MACSSHISVGAKHCYWNSLLRRQPTDYRRHLTNGVEKASIEYRTASRCATCLSLHYQRLRHFL